MKSKISTAANAIGERLQSEEGRKEVLRRALELLGKVTVALFVIYSVLLLFGLLAMGWIAERNIFFSVLLYVPSHLWLLPYFALLPAAVFFSRKTVLLILAAVLVFGFFYMDWEMSGARADKGGKTLTLITFNRAGRDGSLRPFKNHMQADLILLQEARRKANDYLIAEGYSEFIYGDDIGEFTVVSKFPVKATGELVYTVGDEEAHVGGRFEVDLDGTKVAIYNIHLRTPRDALRSMGRGAFLWGILGIPGTPAAKKRQFYQTFWDDQIEIAEKLVEDLKAEKLPFLVGGDFNAPDRGYINRLFDRALEDSHEAAGKGFGFSFPGNTRNPLALFRPWLRLDKLYAGKGWRTLSSEVESLRPTEHLSVGARFELKSDR